MRTALIVLLLLAGCQAAADPAPNLGEQVLAAHDRMHQRFDATRRMQLAIGLSDLDRARAEAKIIEDLDEPDFLPAWRPYVDKIRAAAHEVRQAPDIIAAAKTSAQLGRQCAQCHQAANARLVFSKEAAPPADPKLASQMFTHQWAAARMWEGLIAPNDDRWLLGARSLANARVDVVAEGGPGSLGVADDMARVRLLATRALGPKSQYERAELYGNLLASCAHCHFAIRDR